MFTPKEFWENVDAHNPYKTIGELIKAGNLNYYRIAQQRSDGIIPKAEDLVRLSNAMHKSLEFLLLGIDRKVYSPRVETIANRCEYLASQEELLLIEHILRIPSDYEIVKKQKKESSGIA